MGKCKRLNAAKSLTCCSFPLVGTYIIHDDGKRGASPGFHDDLIIARAIASAVWRQHPRYRKCQDPEVAERRRYAKEMREKVQAGEKTVRGFFRTCSSGPVKTRDEGVRYDALGNEIPPQPGPDYFWHADCHQSFKRPSGRVRLPRPPHRPHRFGG